MRGKLSEDTNESTSHCNSKPIHKSSGGWIARFLGRDRRFSTRHGQVPVHVGHGEQRIQGIHRLRGQPTSAKRQLRFSGDITMFSEDKRHRSTAGRSRRGRNSQASELCKPIVEEMGQLDRDRATCLPLVRGKTRNNSGRHRE